ncbi:MAG: hypothetical protein E3K32_05360 [wastewater metagenome]|nr:hypothetical protein [Candidatus Loosdrechtia aerotolerans]
MIHNVFRRRTYILRIVFIIALSFFSVASAKGHGDEADTIPQTEEGAWTGVDVSIVGKYATQYGRPPRDPYINTDKGDLLLFVFTLAGVAGGFVIGFTARKLFYENTTGKLTHKKN